MVAAACFYSAYHKIFAVTFDENFARATGSHCAGLYNMMLAVLTAVTIVLGMRMMGAMLISSLIIFPALTSMRIFKSFLGVIIVLGCRGRRLLFCGDGRYPYQYSIPAGASVVVVNMAAFGIFSLIRAVRKVG